MMFQVIEVRRRATCSDVYAAFLLNLAIYAKVAPIVACQFASLTVCVSVLTWIS